MVAREPAAHLVFPSGCTGFARACQHGRVQQRRVWTAAIGAIGAAALGGALAVAALEVASWWASRDRVGPPTERAGGHREAIIVLGCPSRRDGSPSGTQRHRTLVAVRSRDPRASRSVLIFTGRTLGAFQGVVRHRSEADVMGENAIAEFGVDPRDVIVEPAATSTRENVAHTIPIIRELGVDRVVFASTPFHARRARGELLELAPDLAPRLDLAEDHRVGEAVVRRTFDAAYEVRRGLYFALRARRRGAR